MENRSKSTKPAGSRDRKREITDPTAAIRERPRFHLIYLLVAILGVLILRDALIGMAEIDQLPYSEFEALLVEGKVAEVVIQGDTIRGIYVDSPDGKTKFVTNLVDPALAERLTDSGVTYSSRAPHTLIPMLLSWLVPVLLFFGIWLLIMRRMASSMGGGGGSIVRCS